MHAKILQNGCAIWCTNHPKCNYEKNVNTDKAKKLIFENDGTKSATPHKKRLTGNRFK